jgi:hypothetical protein
MTPRQIGIAEKDFRNTNEIFPDGKVMLLRSDVAAQ